VELVHPGDLSNLKPTHKPQYVETGAKLFNNDGNMFIHFCDFVGTTHL